MSETLDDGWVGILAPATVANVGPGFDCLGFSLGAPGDVVKARLTDEAGVVRIDEIRGPQGAGLPLEVEKNCAGVAARSALAGDPDRRPP